MERRRLGFRPGAHGRGGQRRAVFVLGGGRIPGVRGLWWASQDGQQLLEPPGSPHRVWREEGVQPTVTGPGGWGRPGRPWVPLKDAGSSGSSHSWACVVSAPLILRLLWMLPAGHKASCLPLPPSRSPGPGGTLNPQERTGHFPPGERAGTATESGVCGQALPC